MAKLIVRLKNAVAAGAPPAVVVPSAPPPEVTVPSPEVTVPSPARFLTKAAFLAELRRRHAAGLALHGDTYDVRENVKLAGGIWDKREKVWLMPDAEILARMQALLAEPTQTQPSAAGNSPVPATAGAGEFKAECDRRRAAGLLLTGNTWPIRSVIKDEGGIWDALTKGWLMPTPEAFARMQAILPAKTGGRRRSYRRGHWVRH